MASSSDLTEIARVAHLFKVKGYSATKAMGKKDYVPSKRLSMDGYEWDIYIPSHDTQWHYWIAFRLVFLGPMRSSDDVKAALRCRLMDPSSSSSHHMHVGAHGKAYKSHPFKRPGDSSSWILLLKRIDLEARSILVDDSFTVQCTITVLKDDAAAAAAPFSGLQRHLGELLRSGKGADVKFLVYGESFAAHRCVLAARSPVFKDELYGGTNGEIASPCVEFKDMEADVFRALLHFICTDTLPPDLGLDQQEERGASTCWMLQMRMDLKGSRKYVKRSTLFELGI